MVAKAIPLTDEAIAFLLVTGVCSGMSIITCGFIVLTEGPSFNLTSDRDRQRFLACVAVSAGVLGLLGNGWGEGKHGTDVFHTVISFFFNFLVQIGLVVIVHNSIIRVLAARWSSFSTESLKRISRYCLIFYLLPLPVMTPTFIADIHPKDAGVKVVARYMNIVFVCVIEAMATASDLYLLSRFTENKGGSKLRRKILREMWLIYICIWFTVCADIAAKITRNNTGNLIADLTITNLTVALRAVANMKYGTTLREARQKFSVNSGQVVNDNSRSGPSSSATLHVKAPWQKSNDLSLDRIPHPYQAEPVSLSFPSQDKELETTPGVHILQQV